MSNLPTQISQINEEFPVQGRENSSQGFRDNFASIKAALTTIKEELDAVQADKLSISAPATSLDFNTLADASLVNVFGRVNAEAFPQTSDVSIDVLLGGSEYYKYIVGAGMTTVSFTNWPESGLLARFRVELVSDGTARQVILGTPSITITTPATQGASTVVEIWSYDAGASIYFTTLGTFTPAA